MTKKSKLVGVIAVLLLLTGCGPTREVPRESCTSQYTGRERTYTQMIQQCYSYNAQGGCTMSVPIYNQITNREVITACTFKEWQ